MSELVSTGDQTVQDRLDELQRQLDEAQQTIRALIGDEIDSLTEPVGGSPVLLRDAQAKLHEREQLLRAIFDSAMDAMVTLDDDGAIINANSAACRAFDLGKEQLSGRRALESAADGFAGNDTWRAFMRAGALAGELPLRRPDGSLRALEYNAVANVLPGIHLWVLRDVTERNAAQQRLHETEHQLSTVISAAPVILFALDRDGVFTLHEGKGLERLGLTAGQAVGTSFFALDPRSRQVFERVMRGETAMTEFVGPIGTMFEATLRPMHDASGTVTGVSGVAIDVSERKAAEQALRDSEARFRAMIENSGDGIFLYAPDSTVSFSSGSAARILGYTPAEVAGVHALDFVEPAYRQLVENEVARLVANPGASSTIEYRVRRRDGSSIWVESVSTNLIADPAVGALVANFRDITERKVAEMQLRESNKRFEAAERLAQLGTWGARGSFEEPISWSHECARIFGRAHDSPPTITAFMSFVHPDDRERVIAASRAALESGHPAVSVHRIMRPDGELRWVDTVANIEGGLRVVGGEFELDTSTPYRTVGVVKDITDRKRVEAQLLASEHRYRRIVENTSDGVWMYDAAGVTTFMSARLAEMLGTTVEDAIGQPIYAYMAAGTREQARQGMERRRVGIGESFEVHLQRADGSELWTLVRADPLLDHQGRFEGALALVTDITERRKAEQTLRQTEEQLRQAQKMEAIGTLAGGVAHDFNNLLTVVLSYTNMILDDLPLADPLRPDLEEIHRAGERATQLTRQLLAFGRKQMLQPVVLDLNEVVAGVQRMLARILGEDIDVTVIAAPRLDKIYADAGQIEQVIVNLVVNARDSMPGGGSLTIETANVELEDPRVAEQSGIAMGHYVMLAISDTGVGMDRDTQSRIFEPFFTTKDKSKGTGLGLSTVYGIVQQSNGHIAVQSERGAGTTLRIYLPRTELRNHESQRIPVAPDPDALGGGETVLLVEDDTSVRGVMRSVLRKAGYVLLEAENAGEAFLLSEQFNARIHLLLTDVVMPRMSGRQLAERLLLQRPDLKVLFVSGYTDDTIVHDGALDADVDFLPKPITPELLLRKVRMVLDGTTRAAAKTRA